MVNLPRLVGVFLVFACLGVPYDPNGGPAFSATSTLRNEKAQSTRRQVVEP